MSKIEEIEQAAEQLPLKDFVKLAIWVDQRRRQMECSPSAADQSRAVVRGHSTFLNSYPRKTRGFTMMPQPGEIWLADIPFTSGTASKLRPVLVLWTDASDVVVAAVTSAPPRSATDVALQIWSAAGLRVASTPRYDSPGWIAWNKSFCVGVWASSPKATRRI